jgi:hypothetical protein
VTPWLTVICPTIGRDTLGRTLRSIRAQAPPEAVEILVVGDTHGATFAEDLRRVPTVCANWDACYLEHDGGLHAWGHPQRTYAQTLAGGRWLWWLQDDDIAAAGAVATIREAIGLQSAPLPCLFQTRTWQAGVVWKSHDLRLGNIDADGLLAPNDPARLAPWPPEYNGDFTMIAETVERWGGLWWNQGVIAIGHPKVRDLWMP